MLSFAIPFIAVIGLIVIMSSVIGAVSIGGGSDGSNDSGYLFRDLPFLADYYTCTSDFEVVAIRQVRDCLSSGHRFGGI